MEQNVCCKKRHHYKWDLVSRRIYLYEEVLKNKDIWCLLYF
jgi:hypothetical protein